MALPSLNAVQEQFLKVFDLGRAELSEDAFSLLHILIAIEVVLAGIFLAIGGRADLTQVARRIIKIGIFTWIITSYDELLKIVLDGFLYAGERAAGASALDLATLQNPDALIAESFRIVTPAFNKVFTLSGEGLLGFPSLDNIMVLCCVSIGFFGLLTLALQVFVTYVEFMVIAASGFILVPLGVFPPLAFLSEKVFGAIISFGVRLLVLSVIIGISHTIMRQMALTEVLSWNEVWQFLITSSALFFISFHAPSVAQSLLYGSPSLTAGSITSAAAGTLSYANLATSTIQSTTNRSRSAVSSALGAAMTSPVYAAGTIRGMAQSKESTVTSSKNQEALKGELYGGVQGVARGAMKAVYNSTLERPVQSVKQSYSAGKNRGVSLQGRRSKTASPNENKNSPKDKII